MSRTLARLAALLPLTGGLGLLAASPAWAHEAWFVDSPDRYPLDWAALVAPLTLAGAAVAVLVTVAWRAAARRLPTPELAPLQRLDGLVPYVPRLLAAHLGVSLLLLSWTGTVLDPAVHAPASAVGLLLLLPQVAAGTLLLLGRAVRAAATAVLAAAPVLVALRGPRMLLTCAVMAGLALFLALVPPARDARADLSPLRLRPALLALRLGAGVSLISLAVVEKLADPEMGLAMLRQQPVLNLLAPVGVDDRTFVLVAGCVELLFGLLVLSGAAPQVVGLVAAVPFTASLALFGGTELIGHLPVYGVLLAFVVLGSRAATAAQVSYLPRPQWPAPARALAWSR